MNEQTAKLLQKGSEPLRDAPDIFFRRRSARIGVHHIALTIVGNYLSTVLDDFSRYILARKLCPTMKAEDVISTLELFHPGGSLETNSRQKAEPPPISARRWMFKIIRLLVPWG